MNESKWKVSSQSLGGGIEIYRVYRIIKPNEVDHSGNKEVYPAEFNSFFEARAMARQLNGGDEI